MPGDDRMPGEPLTEAEQLAANIAELYWAHVRAGMPPLIAAVYLGVRHATTISMNRETEEG
jgi:hypothetical protein